MKKLLLDARSEIVQLRHRVEILSAQMAIVDVFAAALGLRRENLGEAPDVIWAIEKELAKLADKK